MNRKKEGGLSTRRARTATGLPPDSDAEDEGEDADTEEGDIERLPFDDGVHQCNEKKQHSVECEQDRDELLHPDAS
jgi:hypothetical protein